MEIQAIIEVRKPVKCKSCGEILAWELVHPLQEICLSGSIIYDIMSLIGETHVPLGSPMKMLSDDELNCIYEWQNEDVLSKIDRITYSGEEKPFLRFSKAKTEEEKYYDSRRNFTAALFILSFVLILTSMLQLCYFKGSSNLYTIISVVLGLLGGLCMLAYSYKGIQEINFSHEKTDFLLASYVNKKCPNCGKVSNEKVEDTVLWFESCALDHFRKEITFENRKKAELTLDELSRLSKLINKYENAESESTKYMGRKIKGLMDEATKNDAQIVMEIVDDAFHF